MKLKRIFVAIIGIISVLPSMAQVRDYYYDNNIYYGIRLGLGLATVNSDDPELDGGSMQAGLNLGGIIGFQLSDSAPVYLESGLLYTEKGGKGMYQGKKFTFDLNYLKMPIIAKYSTEVYEDLSIQPYAGGYLALGVGGKIKNYADKESQASFSSSKFSRFDGGLTIGCGIQYQVLYADIAYEFGLSNISNDDFESSHTGCFYINCGVNF